MKRLYTTLCTVSLTLFSGFSANSYADDTEIYFLQQGVRPNILFMLDYSDELKDKVVNEEGKTTSSTHLDVIQEALLQLLDEVEDVNIGIGRFARHDQNDNQAGEVNAPIEHRVGYVNDVVKVENPDDTTRNLTVKVKDGADDATENKTTGVVSLVDTELVLNQCTNPCEIVEVTSACTGTTVTVDGVEVQVNEHTCAVDTPDISEIAICHIPPGKPENAHTIYVSKNSWPAHLAHGDVPGPCAAEKDDAGKTNLEKAFEGKKGNAKIDICHTAKGDNPHTISIAEPAAKNHLAHHCDTIGACIDPPSVTCSSDCTEVCTEGAQYLAVRFQGVNIPQGVTINSATIDFNVAAAVSGVSKLGIKASTEAFTGEDKSISSLSTGSEVSWNVYQDWEADSVVSTPDIKSLVSEITDGNEWCGGSDLTFIIESTSDEALRQLVSYDGDASKAPALNLEFDVPVDNTGCINAVINESVAMGSNDVEEVESGSEAGILYMYSDQLELGTRIIGLRFQDIAIDQGTKILNAHIALKAADASTDNNGLDIYGESPTSLTTKFEEGQSFHLTNRYNESKTTAKAAWSPDDWEAGTYYDSPDIANVVQEIVDNGAWEASDNMVFFIRGDGNRVASSFESGGAASLYIQIEGDASETGSETTIRSELKEIVEEMSAPPPNTHWKSPTVDGLYEAAQYYLGQDIDYGLTRHDDRFYLVSNLNTYGDLIDNLTQDEQCDLNKNPYHPSCASEEIDSGTVYVSPMECSTPSYNHVVILSDGLAEVADSQSKIDNIIGSSCSPKFELDGVEYDAENIGAGFDGRCGVDLADHLISEGITTHTIGLQVSGNELATAFLKRLASENEDGGRNFYNVDSTSELVNALNSVVTTIATSSSSFAAPGISVDRYNPIRHNEEAYFALFKPGKTTRWDGNLKKFKLTKDGLFDADGNPAVSASSNYLNADSRSFWSSEADGSQIKKGGSGEQMQADQNERQLYTSVDNNLFPLSSVAGSLGLSESLANWIIGVDVNDEDGDGDVTEDRWLFADPLHSRPLAFSYTAGTADTADVTKVFVGTNDGLFRAIDANTGQEDWAFLPAELVEMQQALMNNEAVTSNSSRPYYGMDGSPQLWINNLGGDNIESGDAVRLYVGMRRGGRNIYALDVTNTSYPDLMWTVKGGDSGFEKLGQTWSSPKPVKVDSSYCGSNYPYSCMVVMFGGGYHSSHDNPNGGATPFTATDGEDGGGNAIYMVNARTGELLLEVSNDTSGFEDMVYPIPSDLALVDTNGDNTADRVYVGDIGGQVWRVDLSNADSTSGGLVADLASAGNDRRFFYPPVWTKLDNGSDLLIIGSGTRQNPLETAVGNRLYAFLDASGAGTTVTNSNLSNATSNDSEHFANGGLGWYLELTKSGEKVLSSAIVDEVGDTKVVSFSTYTPASASVDGCAGGTEGQSWLYIMKLATGGAAFNVTEDGQFDSSTEADDAVADRSVETRAGISSGPKKMFFDAEGAASSTGITDGFINPIDTGDNVAETLMWKEQ